MLFAACNANGYSIVATGPTTFRIARTFRPRWATVCASVGAVLLLGLGLFFLLVRRTESANATVVVDRTGVTVHIDGNVVAPLIKMVEQHLAETAAPTPEVPTLSAVAGREQSVLNGANPGDTVARPRRTVHPGPVGPPVVRFSSGHQVVLHQPVIIGRDPRDDPRLPDAARMRINDMSLSRTHLVVGSNGAGAWVFDCHSTNGVSIVAEGRQTSCTPGVHTEVPVGAVVAFGDSSLTVESG